MTSISQALSHRFDAGVRRRGASYLRDGRVRIDSSSARHVNASVRGATRYQVELRREDTGVHAVCTCPYFDHDMCKHIWAVVLAADARQLLRDDHDVGQLDDTHIPHDPHDPHDPYDPHARGRADWRRLLAALGPRDPAVATLPRTPWPATRRLFYVIDVATSRSRGGVHLEVVTREPKNDGTLGKPRSHALPRDLADRLPEGVDRRVLAVLAGADQLYAPRGHGYSSSYGAYASMPSHYTLSEAQSEMLLPELCDTGRCQLRLQPGDDHQNWLPVAWEDAEPWQFELEVHGSARKKQYELNGSLRRGAETMDIAEPMLLTSAGILFTREHGARYVHGGSFDWIQLLREHGPLRVPVAQCDELMTALYRMPTLPPLTLPAELRYEEVDITPRPCLAVRPADRGLRQERFRGQLSFDYAGTPVARGEPDYGIVQAAERRVLKRNRVAEHEAEQQLEQIGWRPAPPDYQSTDDEPGLEIPASRLPQVTRELIAAGWHVEAEGKPYRPAGDFDFRVASGIDWFELHGTIEFGDTVAQLPELLAAARRGQHWVTLGDGSFGLLPEEWLAKYGALAELGTADGDHLRFERSQVGLLDALLAAQPEARADAQFARVRRKLARFAGVSAVNPPAGFCGTLRPYQKEGLGWFNFLREFGFGGCLADDMGLGKTVQVLALLEARRAKRSRGAGRERQAGRPAYGESASDTPMRPSLVVAPRSLIFNWAEEAARFTPRLRVLDHTGPQRSKGHEHFDDFDLVLTTYGTLRRDIVHFKDARFDYAILDEAQAIKNASSASAKAARLLQADHRLALSGTPVENHLGELWSLFDFLNPGMLGAVSAFGKVHGNGTDGLDDEARALIARALRPFMLRRTKEQVLDDLPPKVEQTLHCELPPKQRIEYDKLRRYYRGALLKRIERDGIKRSKLKILEALLRLRQAAIHPGLIDSGRAAEPSAKLDLLLERVHEVIDEGHKSLVFSQFTSMLGILRANLDRLGIAYEYLDGKTRNRHERVERFQNDADCPLFLISLKAGGVGLNLTAAQYVFLLDPWWNPAVEMQAIDRTHRIGQKKRVFAYRLIARDTIEEKVLELQNAKRELADAIVGGNKDLIRTLGKEDLELLLG